MGILNSLAKLLVQITMDDRERDLKTGHQFEEYVANLFTSQGNYFSIKEWTSDNFNKSKNIKVESNQNPDLVIQYNPTKKLFAVECKFRRGLFENSKSQDGVALKWSYPEQIERYRKFSETRKIPVFIVIGLGEFPDDPEFLFCIPLLEAKYPELFPSFLEKYERSPKKFFFWKDGKLT